MRFVIGLMAASGSAGVLPSITIVANGHVVNVHTRMVPVLQRPGRGLQLICKRLQ
jgi:hypothetical protein